VLLIDVTQRFNTIQIANICDDFRCFMSFTQMIKYTIQVIPISLLPFVEVGVDNLPDTYFTLCNRLTTWFVLTLQSHHSVQTQNAIQHISPSLVTFLKISTYCRTSSFCVFNNIFVVCHRRDCVKPVCVVLCCVVLVCGEGGNNCSNFGV
jgi:DMSO reductase anchor subunit